MLMASSLHDLLRPRCARDLDGCASRMCFFSSCVDVYTIFNAPFTSQGDGAFMFVFVLMVL